MTDASTPEHPGWYLDEADRSQERWWDGRAWTAHTREVALAATTSEPVRRVSTGSRRVPLLAAVLIGVGALLVGSVGGLAVGLAGGATVAAAGRATPVAADSSAQAAATPSEVPSAAFQYTTDMFTVTLKTVSKQCFGSAGCNVSVQPVISADTSSIPSDATGSLTYEISGDESGPITVTTDLTGTQYSQQTSDLSTTSSTKKITVKVTDVQTN